MGNGNDSTVRITTEVVDGHLMVTVHVGSINSSVRIMRPEWEKVLNAYNDCSAILGVPEIIERQVPEWINGLLVSMALINAGKYICDANGCRMPTDKFSSLQKHMTNNQNWTQGKILQKSKEWSDKNIGNREKYTAEIWGGATSVNDLYAFLVVVADWGNLDVNGVMISNREELNELREKICGLCGVIILKRNGRFSNASLWEKYKMLDGSIRIYDTVYFWELGNNPIRDSFVKIENNEEEAINSAAVKGFKIIDEISRHLQVEVGLSIYKHKIHGTGEEGFSLGGLSINDAEVVEMKHIDNTVAFIHTHVGRVNEIVGARENSFFISGQDFSSAYSKGIKTYMKHIDNDRILKAYPLKKDGKLDADRSKAIIADCHLREICFRHTGNENFCHEVNKDIQVRSEILLGQTPINNVGKNDCLLGVFKGHGQKVYEIDRATGSERKL